MNSLYVQTDACEATGLDDEVMILNTNHYTITKVNEMGGFCWSLLTEPTTIENMINAISREYQPAFNKNMIEQDVKMFLEQLLELGLVRYAS